MQFADNITSRIHFISEGAIHIKKEMTKFLAYSVLVTGLLMWLSDASFITSWFAALLIASIGFLFGDIVVFRKTNNIIATVADFVFVFAVLWIFKELMFWNTTLTDILIISLVMAAFEYVFHIWIDHDNRELRKKQTYGTKES